MDAGANAELIHRLIRPAASGAVAEPLRCRAPRQTSLRDSGKQRHRARQHGGLAGLSWDLSIIAMSNMRLETEEVVPRVVRSATSSTKNAQAIVAINVLDAGGSAGVIGGKT
jgi:hypothetical protein